jgi:bacteriocin-like protein
VTKKNDSLNGLDGTKISKLKTYRVADELDEKDLNKISGGASLFGFMPQFPGKIHGGH